MQKALELNGKKLMGQDLKLDRARSKEGPQDGKRGKTGRGHEFSFPLNVKYQQPLQFLTRTWSLGTRG